MEVPWGITPHATFIFENSPNATPKRKMWGIRHIICPPSENVFGTGHVPVSPTKLRITLLWLHHNHKVCVSYQTDTSWLSKPICLCIRMEFVIGTISRSCELFSLLCSCFRLCGTGASVYGKWCFVFMCSAVGVAWFARNIRHISTSGRLRLGAFKNL